MSNATFKASEVFSMVNLPFSGNGYNQNAVVEYLTEYFGDNEYSSVSDLVRDLQMSAYSSGALGMCYTWQLDDFLAHNIDAIEEVLDYYMECTGEDITVQSISGMLVIALDVAVNEIAHAIEHADIQAVVSFADHDDDEPQVTLTDDAEGTREDIIQARMEIEVSHSQYTLTDEQYDALYETLEDLVGILA